MMKRCETGRVPQMKERVGEKANFLLGRRIKEVEERLTGDTDQILRDLEAVFIKLVSGKEDGVLVISFLRSSYILNNHEFYIAYYEGEPFVEEEPSCLYFSIKSILGSIEEDWKELAEELHHHFIRVFAWEKEEIHRWYMEQIYIALEDVMKTAIENMRENGSIEVCYGGYMEEVKVIGSI